jgi:O-antigen ligase
LVTETTFREHTGGGDAAGAFAFAGLLIVLAWQQGGYHSATWTSTTICLACVGFAGLWLRGRDGLNRLELLMLAALASFAALLVLSTLWSDDPASSLRESRRAILYLVALAAFLVVRPRARFLLLVLGAALTGIVLLSAPIGYANSVGILAVAAMLLAVEVATVERGWIRWLALAALVPLTTHLLATSSRGAWLALAVGLLLRAALPQQRRFLATCAGRVALVAVITAIATVIVVSPTNPFGEQRASYWAVAWHEYQAHAVLGSGAGTYARYWRTERPIPVRVQDAHSLYLETLAETGPLGLLLIAVALATPLTVAIRRGAPGVLALAPAYVAFLVHAGIDWDWEMPVVTLVGLLCGAALLQSPPDETGSGAPPGRRAGGRVHFG